MLGERLENRADTSGVKRTDWFHPCCGRAYTYEGKSTEGGWEEEDSKKIICELEVTGILQVVHWMNE